MSLFSFTSEPPLREDMAGRDGRASRAWHVWFSFVASRLSKALIAAVTVDLGPISPLARQSVTVTVPGAAVGDFAIASFVPASADLTMMAHVSAAETVTVWFLNLSAATTVDLLPGTLRVRVEKV
jgi:hypothetical protein